MQTTVRSFQWLFANSTPEALRSGLMGRGSMSWHPSDQVEPIALEMPPAPYEKPSVTRVWLQFAFFWVAMYMQLVIGKIVHNVGHYSGMNYDVPPLKDFIHDFADISWTEHQPWLPDAFVMTSFGFTAVLFLTHTNFRAIFNKYLITHTTVLLMRGTTMFITVVPSPILHCRNANNYVDNPGHLDDNHSVFTPTLSGGGMSMFCNDMIFSGHTIMNGVCVLFWLHSCVPRWVKGIALIYGVCAAMMSIVTRDHYSVDVLLSVYITTSVFWIHRKEVMYWFSAPSAVVQRPVLKKVQ